MGDSGEWGADTQDRHHGVPELEGGGGERHFSAFCSVRACPEGAPFFAILKTVILGYVGRIVGGLRNFEAGWRDLGGKSQDLWRILKILVNKKGF